MSKENDLRKWKSNRTRSWFHLVYGIPIGATLIVIVWAVGYWLPIPTWLIVLIIMVEAFVFLIDAINVVVLNRRIRRVESKV